MADKSKKDISVKKILWNICILASFYVLGACASITEGTDQSITAQTQPSEAKCEFQRDGTTIGVVNPTPGTITVSKSKDEISVTCSKKGHQDGVGILSSEFNGMTVGNVLFGGIIGVGIDAASGAMNEYPNQIVVHLTPEKFSSQNNMALYFRQRRAEIKEKAKKAVEAIHENCGDPENKEKCAKAVELVRQRKETRLAEVEADQAEADVDSGS